MLVFVCVYSSAYSELQSLDFLVALTSNYLYKYIGVVQMLLVALKGSLD